jgi:hypothetical protein
MKPKTTLEYKAVAIRERSSQRGEFCLTELGGLSHAYKQHYEAAVLIDFWKRLMGIEFKRSCNEIIIINGNSLLFTLSF